MHCRESQYDKRLNKSRTVVSSFMSSSSSKQVQDILRNINHLVYLDWEGRKLAQVCPTEYEKLKTTAVFVLILLKNRACKKCCSLHLRGWAFYDKYLFRGWAFYDKYLFFKVFNSANFLFSLCPINLQAERQWKIINFSFKRR